MVQIRKYLSRQYTKAKRYPFECFTALAFASIAISTIFEGAKLFAVLSAVLIIVGWLKLRPGSFRKELRQEDIIKRDGKRIWVISEHEHLQGTNINASLVDKMGSELIDGPEIDFKSGNVCIFAGENFNESRYITITGI